MIKVSGVVIKGKQKGRKLGFPTANIKASNFPTSGVYQGFTEISGRKYKSAIFIPERANFIESHIIGFSGDIYGQVIMVEIGKKIRDIRIFSNEKDLIEQITKDIDIINNIE